MNEKELVEVRCQHCDLLIGVEVAHNGKTFLRVGEAELYSVHGWHDCPVTGVREQVHWDSADVIFRRILER